MATIVNARDVLLQAANPRVAGVTQTNLTVDQSQVTGLGLVMSGVKRITGTASGQVFLVPSVGSVTPSSITIVVSINGFAAVPTMSVLSGTISPVPTAVEGVFTLPATSMSSASAVIRISATDTSVTPNVTYTDDFTLLRQVEGDSTVRGFLTQEDIILPADFLGNVVSYFGASGNFKVYQGTNDITSLCTFSLLSNPSGFTQTINATTGAYAITGGMPTGTDSTSITYRATFGATTVDKIFSIRKSKAVQITQGSDGAPGTNGVRGSRTFYVTLSGSTNTYSDSLATTTASVDGGPVKNDVVTQSNSSQGFSQSKFWDGSVWNIINAVVDGNLIVTGTIGAGKLSANSVDTTNLIAQAITVDKLRVTGGPGGAINPDPNTQDITEWIGGTFTLIPDSTAPNGRAIEITSQGQTTRSVRLNPIDINKNYLVRINAKRTVGTASCYLGIDFLDVNGASIACSGNAVAGTWAGGGGTYWYFGLVSQTPSTNYVEYSTSFGPNEVAQIPAGARFARIVVLGNYVGVGTQRFSNLRLMEKTTAALVVDGSLTAQKIDTRNLTVKDGSGNVIFGVGSTVDAASYMAAAFGTNYVYNPDFANKQDGWTYSAGAISQDSSGFDLTNWFPTGGHALWTHQAGTIGNSNAYYEWYSNKIPVEVGQRYIVSAYTGAHRCRVGVFFYVYDSSDVAISNSYANGDPDNNEAASGGTQLGGWKRCYSYLTIPAGAVYVRVMLRKYDTAAGQTDSYLFATNVQLERSTPTATKPGPYASTGYLDASSVRSLNPITSSNVTTYVGSAAIGTAQVGVLTAANLTVTALSNTVNGSTGSGQRVEIQSNKVLVYDNSNVLRVKLGDLS